MGDRAIMYQTAGSTQGSAAESSTAITGARRLTQHFDARGVRRPERDARELVRRPHREVHVPAPDAFLEV